MSRILICGATSRIAQETALCFARAGGELFLIGRNTEKLGFVKSALEQAGARRVEVLSVDLAELDKHQEILDAAMVALGSIDGVLIAHGVLDSQLECERSVARTMDVLQANFMSAVSLLTILANYFEPRRRGVIAVITSIAGDRGRRSHYIYGTSKGALNIFLQGLRCRLHPAGVSVITVKPGYVDTPMTDSMKKNILFAKPSYVGRKIYRAMKGHKDVVYVPGFWRLFMFGVKAIPESFFKRMGV